MSLILTCPRAHRCPLWRQFRRPSGPRVTERRRREALGRRAREEEAQAQSDHVHHVSVARARASVREVALSGRVQPRGARAQGQPAGGARAGEAADEWMGVWIEGRKGKKETGIEDRQMDGWIVRMCGLVYEMDAILFCLIWIIFPFFCHSYARVMR